MAAFEQFCLNVGLRTAWLDSLENTVLLVCATNYIRRLDPAMLRPGRFYCIIPVGALDREGRTTILEF